MSVRYDNAILALGPVGYWPLDDAVGSANARDRSGDELAGTYQGAPTLRQTPGPIAASGAPYVAFDGAADYVALPDLSVAEGTLYSYMAWLRTAAAPSDCVMGEFRNTGTVEWARLVLTGGELQWQLRNGAGTQYLLDTNTAVDDSAWHMVVGVRDGDTIRAYVDGSEVGTPVTGVSGSWANVNAALIGARWWNSAIDLHFPGWISQVAVFDRALTDTHISDLHALGISTENPPTGPGPPPTDPARTLATMVPAATYNTDGDPISGAYRPGTT